MNDKNQYNLTDIKAMKQNKKWFSWSSPVGLVIFLNGITTFGILTQYLFGS